MSDTCIIIPARFKSSRFPGKPLIRILGKSMIVRVAELACKIIEKEDIYIATDDDKIKKEIIDNGYQCIKTEEEALTGTDRVALASEKLDYKFFINIQGDEPLIDPKDIQKCINLKKNFPEYVINGYCHIGKNEDVYSKNIPKLITDQNNNLLYISRGIIPSHKESELINPYCYKKQVCIYGFTKKELEKFHCFGRKTNLEALEDIEILRFLELGMKVKMFKCKEGSLAVDIPSDVEKVEKALLLKMKNK
mgnify:CR=1 FL=1